MSGNKVKLSDIEGMLAGCHNSETMGDALGYLCKAVEMMVKYIEEHDTEAQKDD